MLKVNKKNESADTKNIKKKFNPECIGIICAGTLMTGVIVKVAASCIDLGSIKEVDLKSTSDLNKAIFEINDEEVSLDILGYSKNNKIKLKDGTILDLSDDNLTLYNNYLINNDNITYIEYNGNTKSKSKTDRAMIDIGNNAMAVSISKVQYDKLATLTLSDGTNILVSDDKLKLYSSESSIMKQIEDEFQAVTYDENVFYNKNKKCDKALLIQDNDIFKFDLKKYKIENNRITLILENNQIIETSFDNVILYSSTSHIMMNILNQLEEMQNEKEKIKLR